MNPSTLQLRKPVFLLGTCDLLRSNAHGDFKQRWLTRLLDYTSSPDPKVACISIDQQVEQLGLEFSSVIDAMKCLGVTDCRLVTSQPDTAEQEWLMQADLLVIIGSNSISERQVFFNSFLFDLIHQVVEKGITVLAVGEGAESLGYWQQDSTGQSLMPGLELLPALIQVQEDIENQGMLTDWVQTLDEKEQPMVGLGISSNGAAIIHPGFRLEPVGMPMSCLTPIEGVIDHEVIIPDPTPHKYRLH